MLGKRKPQPHYSLPATISSKKKIVTLLNKYSAKIYKGCHELSNDQGGKATDKAHKADGKETDKNHTPEVEGVQLSSIYHSIEQDGILSRWLIFCMIQT